MWCLSRERGHPARLSSREPSVRCGQDARAPGSRRVRILGSTVTQVLQLMVSSRFNSPQKRRTSRKSGYPPDCRDVAADSAGRKAADARGSSSRFNLHFIAASPVRPSSTLAIARPHSTPAERSGACAERARRQRTHHVRAGESSGSGRESGIVGCASTCGRNARYRLRTLPGAEERGIASSRLRWQ